MSHIRRVLSFASRRRNPQLEASRRAPARVFVWFCASPWTSSFGYFSPRQQFPLLRLVWSIGVWLDLESFAKLLSPPVSTILANVTMIFQQRCLLLTTTTLGADSKFYLSSTVKTLHLYPTCPGRHARLQTFRVCINCINRLTATSKQPPRGGKGIRHR